MLANDRLNLIISYVDSAKSVTTAELAAKLNVSVVTIRSDLKKLEKNGALFCVHGGAVSLAKRFDREIPTVQKSRINIEEKRIVAELAVTMIDDGDVIILDAGTTTFEIAKHISDKHITVITNDIKIAHYLAGEPKITLIVTGGLVRNDVYTLGGAETINFFDGLRADKLFLGCDAIDWDFGVSNRTLEEVSVKRAMIDASDQIIGVTDHSKLNQRVFARVCLVSELDVLVIDRLSDDDLRTVSEIDLKVMLPAEEKHH